ncbi:formylglycine-generating enzyme family protein [Pelagibius marinus]|uniref:formylglycine-generating enzyme family protein n=1 Tax=Pelagibius marinus TaxID=2762760 RepID=UPI0018724B52|nr:SUMF1/EgtB/PvdO family nonheme iron enzyme [Pelagibius marinus]
MNRRVLGLLCLLAAATPLPAPAAELAPELVPEVVEVPAGPFVAGSDRTEREAAYRLDEAAYGHSVTRKQRWYEAEGARREVELPAFSIMRAPVTNRLYAAFVAATGHRPPDVSAEEWQGYGLIHPYERTRRHAWRGGQPPQGREAHPVVLVSHGDAKAFAAWLSAETGRRWRLPTALEWEKAARGTEGRRFPWGDAWDPRKLNSHDGSGEERGAFDTLPVGSFPAGSSPYGLLDAAGQVFEWTATPAGSSAKGDRFLVKGGSWDDRGCGVCRPAAGHGRPAGLKHILIGFRLVMD